MFRPELSRHEPDRSREIVPTAAAPADTDWTAVAVVVLAGIVAALQIGKVSIGLAALRADLQLDLEAAGWIMGIFAVIGLFGGIPAGAAVKAFGDRRLIIVGLVALAIGSGAGAVAPSIAVLLAARTLEGAGFLLIVVAAPTVLNRTAAPKDRALVFGIWGTFMPTGVALALLTGLVLDGWRAFWLVNAALAALNAVLIAFTVKRSSAAPDSATGHPTWRGLVNDVKSTIGAGGPLVLACAFALYNVQYFALVSFLPMLLTERMGASVVQAGVLSAIVVGVNIAGNLAAGLLLGRGAAPWILIVTALVVTSLTSVGIFAPGMSLYGAVMLCMAFSAVAGLLPATVLYEAPRLAPAAYLAPIAIGLVVHGNNLGQLIGPVVVGGLVDIYGWFAAAIVVAAAGVLGMSQVIVFRRMLTKRPAGT
jgi:DHA1 family inner membrane transport protein